MAVKVPKPNTNPYIRVGTDYFKVIHKPDRFGILRKELKKWSADAIKLDEGGHAALYDVAKYDDFIIAPNNNGQPKALDNLYNMYHDFPHKPRKGNWPWTFQLLRHVFGTQFKSGMLYLQTLYLHPTRALPVLVLVSEERQTGKTTFLDWLNMLFGANMAAIEPDVIGSNFNGEYATSNIIAIDETVIDKQIAVEKIKSLATKKFISVNIKNVAHFKLPFFGKIIMASNNEDKFMRIEDKEIRFWVRKLPLPRIHNHNILDDMVSEIPAFLHYLAGMPKVDFTKSRMVLTVEQIKNEWLDRVKQQSKERIEKELPMYIAEFFAELEPGSHHFDEFYASAIELKERFFEKQYNWGPEYIGNTLVKMGKNKRSKRYVNLDGKSVNKRAYHFKREDFVDTDAENTLDNELPF